MTSANLNDACLSCQKALDDVGIDNEFFRDLIASRLVIERVGETNVQDWWDSRVLSATGRARLEEVTPRTQLQSRIILAIKVGRKAELNHLPTDTFSLFSFGPQMESRISAAIKEIGAVDDVPLKVLESVFVQSLDEGWTHQIIQQIGSNTSARSMKINESDARDSFPIEENGYTQSEIESQKWRLLVTLLQGYGHCTDRLRVPYYVLKPDLKSGNA